METAEAAAPVSSEDLTIAARSCGSCTLCCKILALKDLEKPRNVWCRLCDVGKGCTVYENRPQACRDFHCFWALGVFDEKKDRPDKSRIMVTGHDIPGIGRILVIYENVPSALRRSRRISAYAQTMLQNGMPVIIHERLSPGASNIKVLLPPRIKTPEAKANFLMAYKTWAEGGRGPAVTTTEATNIGGGDEPAAPSEPSDVSTNLEANDPPGSID